MSFFPQNSICKVDRTGEDALPSAMPPFKLKVLARSAAVNHKQAQQHPTVHLHDNTKAQSL